MDYKPRQVSLDHQACAPNRKPNRFLASVGQYSFVGDNAVEVIGTSGTVNRYNEIMSPQAFVNRLETYLANPVVLWSHEWDKLPIGRTDSMSIDGDTMKHVIEFSPLPDAQNIKLLYKTGFLNAWSYGFIIYKVEPVEGTDTYRVADSEILELSGVNIPADSKALTATRKYLYSKDATLSDINDASPAHDWQKTAMRVQHLIAEVRKSPVITDVELSQLSEIALNTAGLMTVDGNKRVLDAVKFFVKAVAVPDNKNAFTNFVQDFADDMGVIRVDDLKLMDIEDILKRLKK